MSGQRKGNRLQMLYKLFTYVLIIFGGTISGSLVGSLAGPVRIIMSAHEVGILGACMGATFAIVGCKFAIEYHEADQRNRELFQALDSRLTKVGRGFEHDSRDR